MSSQGQAVTTRDLVDEAKKRIVILSICVVGLSYLMSLTSTSVWVNLPAAAFLVILFRYFSLDFEMRRKAAAYNSRSNTRDVPIQEKPIDIPKLAIKKDQWKKKVKSPVVEDAIDQLTRHIVSEWVTDLWYSKLTPDREGPDELVQIINGVLGEISYRMKKINLIDLLARDVIHLICKHLELFRACQAKIAKKNLESLSFEERDMELKIVLAAQNKLHPILFSADSEHKVLQHIVDGVISLTFRTDDLQCSFFRYVSRELLACAVMRPVLNLVNPRFINERIEQVVMSSRKRNQGASAADSSQPSKHIGPTNVSSDDFSPFPDPSVTGVELVELKSQASGSMNDPDDIEKLNHTDSLKDPLLLKDARSTRSWGSLPLGSVPAGDSHFEHSSSGGEWGDMLEYFNRRKKQALAPEHFENMWSKGRNYDTKDTLAEDTGFQNSSITRPSVVGNSKIAPKRKENGLKITTTEKDAISSSSSSNIRSISPLLVSDEDDEEHMALDETESGGSYHSSSDNEETTVTGLNTLTTKVWDGRTNRNSGVSHIHHPLEGFDGKSVKRINSGQIRKLHRQRSGWKRSRLGTQKLPVWQEVERKSFGSGDSRDVHPLNQKVKEDDDSDEYDFEFTGRLQSGTTASSSAASLGGSFAPVSSQITLSGDSFFKLRCEVSGANIVRSSSSLFAVYSISVTDAENNSWSIKRRYRHFEELHRRLKEYSVYSLHLPPKHFLSTGFDVPVIRERCKLLDEYLKKLMQLPTISGSIDVWDFLSIDSQTYTFSSAFSIVETLSVKPLENRTSIPNQESSVRNHLKPRKGEVEEKDPSTWMNQNSADGSVHEKSMVKDYGKILVGSCVDSENTVQNNRPPVQAYGSQKGEQKPGLILDADDDPTIPSDWVAPNLSGPILDLVDVIFQLQEGAWIRRKAFWVAKQVLQLGMGDALDDWLVEKIQRLRRGSIVASGINRLEQILWPDGIFITKHPRRQKLSTSASPSTSPPSYHQSSDQASSPKEDEVMKLVEEQEREAMQRAKFVYELMIDNAPAAVVSLVGSKEYEQCAKDLYYFLQSTVCVKQLIIDLLELVLVYAYPELDHVFKQLHNEKHKFGMFKP